MPYIYDADLWCDECGQAICERIQAEGKAPEDPDDETSYDSGEYPKHGHNGGESDSPNHCAAGAECLNAITLSDGSKIGALITEELTAEGEEYVREAIAEGHLCATEVWAAEWPDLKPEEEEDEELPPAEYLRDLAERLRKVPADYGTDGYDVDRLEEIANSLQPAYDLGRKEFDNGGP